jgi:hypothetical protein
MAPRAHKCSGKCIFIKKESASYPKGRWQLVFSSCKGDCKCPKKPPDNVGAIGHVYQTRCKSDQAGGAVHNCAASCQFQLDANGNWIKLVDCGIPGCSCLGPPGGIGGATGDIYSTDCLPDRGGQHKPGRLRPKRG